MRTFNGNQELKNELLKQLKHHQELDAFIQGKWLTKEKVEGNGYKGCFYGCTMQTKEEPILKFSEKYSIDLWYCHLTENIFEGLPYGEYQKFPLQSIEILPVGFDINKIKSPFFYTLLEDQLQYCKDNEVVTEAVKKSRDLFKVDFESIDKAAAESVVRSARVTWSVESASAAAESAARAAARSATESAWSVESAARAAEWSAREAESAVGSGLFSALLSAAGSATGEARSAAESVSLSTAESTVWSAAKKDYYIWLRDLLFKLIKENS